MLEVVTSAGPHERLLGALVELRDRADGARLPLQVAGVDEAKTELRRLVDQLDDYVIPRLRQLDAPLLVVVGGSTGAGKSTLINSVVGAVVSAPGVLRPTTRAPVLVCHPEEQGWFTSQRILPGLSRTTGAASETAEPPHTTVHVLPAANLPAGLALLDAPDIDSVVTENRELATQLLAAADLWIFVTTAARYADAVPWDFLATAQERSAAIAVVLDRVPADATDDVTAHLASMLASHGLGDTPLFVVPESTLEADGLLPPPVIEPVRIWLERLAADAEQRGRVVRRTLDGALDSFSDRIMRLADAADTQLDASARLRALVDAAYSHAVRQVGDGLSDGTLLRGEVLARWQEFVGTGEFLRSLQGHVSRIRDRLSAAVRGKPRPAADLQVALETGVEALIGSAADEAAERTVESWRANPAGGALLTENGIEAGRAGADLRESAAREVRGWQGYVLDLVRSVGASKRTTARFLSFGVNGVGVLVMIVVFAHTAGLTGAEVGVAAGTGVLSQKLLEAIFGDQAVRELAADARRDLSERVEKLLSQEAQRFTELLERANVDPSLGGWFRSQQAAIDAARSARA
jgi:energy-coupling factor transporter ATP-binding protein EcfA2